jgi:hypothetical protein
MKNIVLLVLFLGFNSYFVLSQCSNPYAGQDTAFCGYTAELAVENATTGYWTAYLGEEEMTPAPNYLPLNTSTEISVTVDEFDGYTQIVSFVWSDDSGPCNDTVLVEFVKQPQAYAGQDFDVCGECAELDASLSAMTASWLANGSSYDDYTLPNTGVCSSSYGQQNYTWLITNISSITSVYCSDMDEVVITFWREPTANILIDPADSITCGLSCDFLRAENPGSGVTGHWECSTCGPTWWYPDILPEIQVSSYGYNVFYWIEETGPALNPGFCTDTAGPLAIHFLNDQPLYAGYDEDAFGFEHTLHGLSGAENDQYAECIYLWENEEAIIDDATSLETIVTVPEFGEYEFVLKSYYTNMDDCVDSDTVKIRFLDPLYQLNEGINVKGANIVIFPNPASNYISIESDNPIQHIDVVDINGRIVLSLEIESSLIDVSDLESGIYFMSIYIDDSLEFYKFIKQ